MRFLLHVRSSNEVLHPLLSRALRRRTKTAIYSFRIRKTEHMHQVIPQASFMVSSSGKMRPRRDTTRNPHINMLHYPLRVACNCIYYVVSFSHARATSPMHWATQSATCTAREDCQNTGGDECALNLWRWINVHQDFPSALRREWKFDLCFEGIQFSLSRWQVLRNVGQRFIGFRKEHNKLECEIGL